MIDGVQTIKDFRLILRHFKHLPSFKGKTSSLRFTVINEFRKNQHETNSIKVEQMRALGNSYARMVTDIRELKHLRYLDTGERLDPREKVHRTAARVGLAVPKFSDEN